MGKIKTLINRIISDYFLKNRMDVYEKIISSAIEKDYEFVSHKDFYELVKNNELVGKKLFLIRHDIDTDPKLSYQWLKVEEKYKVKTTYYFRLKTLDFKLMNFIHQSGIHCGYHFEEIATYAKKYNLKNLAILRSKYSEVEQDFKKNLKEINSKLNFKIESIASHGDFANRIFGASNFDFINQELLKETDLLFECYDPLFIDNFTTIISDYEYPTFYRGNKNVLQAIEDNDQIIHFLVHPKHWRSNWYWNTKEAFNRLIEGIKYRNAK
ncbi:MAG: hypothetical protein V4622_06550 [Bacteroidota bacterium]